MAELLSRLWDHLAQLTTAQLTGATFLSVAALLFELWAIGRALSRGHGVAGTLAWLFAILAFPVVGAIAFFVLASPSVKRIALKRRRAATSLRPARIAGVAHAPRATTADSLVDLAGSLTGLEPTTGNRVEVLTDEDPTFARIEEALGAAQRSIWAEYYIIQNDGTGRRFLDLLVERARAGIEVRLIYDALGSMSINARRLRELVAAGGKVRQFQPMNPLRRRFAVHLRNHRKLIVVDGVQGFTGGMNVGDEYSGRRRRRGVKRFRDSHLALAGPAIGSLAQVFAEDWVFSGGDGGEVDAALPMAAAAASTALPVGTSLVAVVPSGPDQEHNASALVHFAAISSARKRAWLTSPYFIPDESMVNALVSAALRRVDVRILLPSPENCDVKLVAAAARSYYGTLLRGGVRLFEYEPSMLHAKTLVVDGAAGVVGSANVDIRSFRLNFEVGALVADAEFASALERRYVRDLANSKEITLDAIARWSRFTRVHCQLARLLSPIL